MKKLALLAILLPIISVVSIDNAYAQDDPSILLRIATQADEQIVNHLDDVYGDSIPADIESLYAQGHAAVMSLEISLYDDVEQARQDFLTAMSFFKYISKTPFEHEESAETSDRDPASHLNRLSKYLENLRSISETHNMGIKFSEIESLFVQAYQQIDSNEDAAAAQSIDQIEYLLDIKQKDIHEQTSQLASDRTKMFVEEQLVMIEVILDDAVASDSEIPQIHDANYLVEEIKVLLSEHYTTEDIVTVQSEDSHDTDANSEYYPTEDAMVAQSQASYDTVNTSSEDYSQDHISAVKTKFAELIEIVKIIKELIR